DRIGTPEGQDRKHEEMARQRRKNSGLHRRSHQASAMLTGASASSTEGSGQRTRPMPRMAASTMPKPQKTRERTNGSGNFSPIAAVSPPASAPLPPTPRT